MRLVGVEKLKKMGAEFDTKRKNRLITPNTSLSILDLSKDDGTSDDKTTSLEGIQTEMILFANTDHLKDGVRLHDDQVVELDLTNLIYMYNTSQNKGRDSFINGSILQ